MQKASGTDKRWGSYPSFSTKYYGQLHPNRLEPILMRNIDKIESFTWITHDIYSYHSVSKTEITDPA